MKACYLPLLLFLLQVHTLPAQEILSVSSKLNEATVFFSGAELTHSATAQLPRGAGELTISGLSQQLDINSIKINADKGVVISSFEFSTDYLTVREKSPAEKRLDDSLKYYREELAKVTTEITVNEKMAEYLRSGIEKNVSGSDTGLGIEELVRTMDYYKEKSTELDGLKRELNGRRNNINLTVYRLQEQLNEISTKTTLTSGILKISYTAPAAGSTNFNISYFTNGATWTPYYDINIASSESPIIISGKANVRQTTGLDWDKVKLTLSTATPSGGKVAPLFNAWLLQQQPLVRALSGALPGIAAQNSVSYAQAEESQLDEVVVVGYGTQKKSSVVGSATSSAAPEPLIIINGIEVTQEEFAMIDADMIKDISVLKDAQATSVYGSRGSSGAIIVTLKEGMEDFISYSDNMLNVVYNIDIPYSIPGNGKIQSIDLTKQETSAEYKYYTAPKLDGEAYLIAEISDWQGLGLLSGKANITYEGTYLGETYIDAGSTHQKLSLTLGTDKRVAVKRELLRDYSSSRSIGSNTEQTFTYRITVRNNQNRSIKMVTKDQYPISTSKNIEVTVRKETTPWTANVEELGVITWEEDLAPGETKTYELSYSVRYPKNMRLNL